MWYNVELVINRNGEKLKCLKKKSSRPLFQQLILQVCNFRTNIWKSYPNLNTKPISIMGDQYVLCTNIFRWSKINMKFIFLYLSVFSFKFGATWFSVTWYYKKCRWNQFKKKCYIELTEMQMSKNGLEHLTGTRDAPQSMLQHLPGVLLPSRRVLLSSTSRGRSKLQTLSTPPRISTSPWRRGLLAAIFPSSQLHCPFPKELWILRAAGHARELCNLVLGSRRAL